MTQREAVATLLRDVESRLPKIEWGTTTKWDYMRLGVDEKLLDSMLVLSQMLEYCKFPDET